MSQMRPLSPQSHKKFKDSEPIFNAIYISTHADMSGTGKDVKKQSAGFFPVFLIFSYEKIKIFISYSPKKCWTPVTVSKK